LSGMWWLLTWIILLEWSLDSLSRSFLYFVSGKALLISSILGLLGDVVHTSFHFFMRSLWYLCFSADALTGTTFLTIGGKSTTLEELRLAACFASSV